jgi:hypothetical protein
MKPEKILLLLFILNAVPVGAEEAAQATAQPQPSVTRAWLDMQSSGKAASAQPQPLSGAAMNQAHERYIKSFSHPIPAYYEYGQAIAR